MREIKPTKYVITIEMMPDATLSDEGQVNLFDTVNDFVESTNLKCFYDSREYRAQVNYDVTNHELKANIPIGFRHVN